MVAKSYVFLGGACIAFIATVGCIFELSSGDAQLGSGVTSAILALALPLGIGLFVAAVKLGRADP